MTRQKAMIVGLQLPGQHDFEYSMEELRNLAAACLIDVVGEMRQSAKAVNPFHYIGSGKLQELRAWLEAEEADLVIFNDELSPSQIRNLEDALEQTVMDRTMLILDIFAERAKTKEAQLQVEVARLQYMLPRLVGLRKSLSRQGGGAAAGGGAGGKGFRNRGGGETKLELDRRRIEDRIAMLQTELDRLVSRRQVQRKQRHKKQIPSVCLVGYTNTGKSSLLNAIMDTCSIRQTGEKHVYSENMLFATLETAVRGIVLPDNKQFLLTDTVGFVSRLPHHLVKAFRSTLEEVAEADLLVHVVDASHPECERFIEVTNETLKELGADRIPVVYAFNKCDLTDQVYPRVCGNTVYMSVLEKKGLRELTDLIREHIFQDYITCEVLIPFVHSRLVAYFNEHAHVLSTEYEPEGTRLRMECRLADYNKYQSCFAAETPQVPIRPD